MCADVYSIRYFYESEVDFFRSIPGTASHAVIGTKLSSSLTEVLALTIVSNVLHFDLGDVEKASSHRSLG